jgi:hypothetical protein
MLEQGGSDNEGVSSGLATEATQLLVKEAIETITIPAPEGGATEEGQTDELSTLLEMLGAIQSIAAAKGILSDLRVTLLGGTLTGVTTVTNMAQVGGIQANGLIPSSQNLLATMGNINNVG